MGQRENNTLIDEFIAADINDRGFAVNFRQKI